ncbi:SCO family protein [Sporosarcina sp. Marseille-Q4063]|uniref:SCO family protein n=1 Tax=Sporosarcina sp. Marseille-Q4063 TaxID=2810514 RepID=UPI001BAEE05C|nr:SCO family protein [Sporosarcina sp. Marseille-Q4063]QUW22845.1 SCO family protein [Sporosarcina sp. Marseille-Q4063]
MSKLILIIQVLCCSLLLLACTPKHQEERKIEPFTFTNQEGQAFGTNELSNTVWVANFIFTNCTTICQPMTAEMASLQHILKEKDFNVEFVSFTVDPAIDTPEKLKSFITDFSADLSNWNLLTGYTQSEIEVFARDQFQTIVQKPVSSTQVIHSSNFYLIGKDGHFVKEYNFVDATYVDEMITDIQELMK